MSLHPNLILTKISDLICEIYNFSNFRCHELNNINYNYETESPLVSRVQIWFDTDTDRGVCVSKIIKDPETLDKYLAYQEFVNESNRKLPKQFFLKFEIHKLADDLWVALFDFVEAHTFEEDLKLAITSPLKSSARLSRALDQQMLQMEYFLSSCELASDDSAPTISGEALAKEFYTSIFGSDDVESNFPLIICDLFSESKFTLGFAIPDLVNPNIFDGPLLIDNLAVDYADLKRTTPIELNRYRYVLLALMSPPISFFSPSIVPAILFISNFRGFTGEDEGIIFPRYAKLLPKRDGVNDRLKNFTLAYFWEMKERVRVFASSPIRLEGIRAEVSKFIKLMEMRANFSRSRMLVKVLEQEALLDVQKIRISPPTVGELECFDMAGMAAIEIDYRSAKLSLESLNGFNVLECNGGYLGVRQSAGGINFVNIESDEYAKLLASGKVLESNSLHDILSGIYSKRVSERIFFERVTSRIWGVIPSILKSVWNKLF